MQTSTSTAASEAQDTGMMDYEMDIDLTVDDEEAMNIELELDATEQGTSHAQNAQQDDVFDVSSHPDLSADKVHIRGLDNLTTEDVRSYALSHYPITAPTRIEWIDDTSANIIYPSAASAFPALRSFLATDSPLSITTTDPLFSPVPARTLAAHPSTSLTVRNALITDVKKPRAYEASRFYLLNPDKDPRENRLRSGDEGAGGRYDRRRDRRSGVSVSHKRSREGDDEHDDENLAPFDENMYDDDPASLAARISRRSRAPPKRRRRSDGEISSDGGTSERDRSAERRRRNGERGDLFAEKGRARVPVAAVVKRDAGTSYGRLKEDRRSASPLRDGDGRLGFEGGTLRARARQRSATPPRLRARGGSGRERSGGGGNAERELFGDLKGKTGVLRGGPAATMVVETETRELFPTKAGGHGHHRRSGAIDGKDELRGGKTGRDLFERINLGGDLAGRITGGPVDASGDEEMLGGFNIRGSASGEQNPGFSIRGLGADHARVKELFPEKAVGERSRANAGVGKDLFESRIRGRRKAEDLFA